MFIELILVLVGFVAGIIGSLVGLGGGFIIVPTLLFVTHDSSAFIPITTSVAVGTSFVLIVLSAFSSTLFYYRRKRIDFYSGWLFFTTSAPGALIGTYFTQYMDSHLFFIFFGMMMLMTSFLFTLKSYVSPIHLHWDVKRTFVDHTGDRKEYGYHRLTTVILCFFIGIFSGLFGIGGGALMVPLMVILFQFPVHLATSTSMFTILLTSIICSMYHIYKGNIDWYACFLLAPGALLGGRVGAFISEQLKTKTLLYVIRIVLVLIALRMIIKGLMI